MTEHRPITTGAERPSDVSPLAASNAPPPAAAGAVLSAADYAELMRELDDLRSRHRGEVSRRLRDARDFGSPGDDDDRQAIREDAAFAEARIAQLEHLARFATVLAVEDVDGVAGLGSVVRVVDEMGGTTGIPAGGPPHHGLQAPRRLLGVAGRQGAHRRSCGRCRAGGASERRDPGAVRARRRAVPADDSRCAGRGGVIACEA